jgi:hypothetical protein
MSGIEETYEENKRLKNKITSLQQELSMEKEKCK